MSDRFSSRMPPPPVSPKGEGKYSLVNAIQVAAVFVRARVPASPPPR